MHAAPRPSGSAWVLWIPAPSSQTTSPGTYVADDGGTDQIERAGLRRDDPVVADPAECEGPDTVEVAERDERAFDECDDRIGALETAHRGRHRLGQRRRVAGDQGGDHLGVGGRSQPDAVGDELFAQHACVRQVAVMAEGDGTGTPVVDQRLGIRPVHAPGRRIPCVPDGDLAGERLELLLVEDLGYESHVAEHRQSASLRDRDPGRLLPAMLQSEEREIREPRHVTLDRTDAEDAAHR